MVTKVKEIVHKNIKVYIEVLDRARARKYERGGATVLFAGTISSSPNSGSPMASADDCILWRGPGQHSAPFPRSPYINYRTPQGEISV